MTPDATDMLEALDRNVRRLLEELERPLPTVLTKERAAQELSIKRTTLEGLIRDGKLHTCVVGKREMVPAREVYRLAGSRSAGARQYRPPKPPKPRAYDPKAEAAKVRQALSKRR